MEHDTLKKPIIGLVSDADALINNVFTQQVLTELRNNCSIISKRFIKRYIKKGLPDLEHFDYSGESSLNFPTHT
jgi:hypothetical protein